MSECFYVLLYLPKYGNSPTADGSPPTMRRLVSGADFTTEAVAASAVSAKRTEEVDFGIIIVVGMY